MRHWIARLLASWLVLMAGCGGGEVDDGARRMAAAMHAQPLSAGSTAPLNVDAAALFDWAEWKYPALFPKGPTNTPILHDGVQYIIRAYANGNYLGLTSVDEVYGLGPFTGGVLLRLGSAGSFAAQVRADACPALGIGCAPPTITTQPLNVHTPVGRAAHFAVVVESPIPVQVRWQSSSDGGASFTDVANATGPNFTLANPTAVDDGKLLRAVVASSAGTVVSRRVQLAVHAAGSTDLFPLHADSRWVYARSNSALPDVVRVDGTQTIDGQVGTVLLTESGQDNSRWRDIYVAAADGVRQYVPQDQLDPFTAPLSGMQLLRLPVVIGDSVLQVDRIVDSGIDVDGDGQPEPVHVVSTLSVVGREALTTPAAQFNDVLHQRQVIVWTLQPSGGLTPPVELRSEVDVWYANRVGQVKWVVRNAGAGTDETVALTLEAYGVGALRSDVTPPTLQSVYPGAAVRHLGNVSVEFDEALDPAGVLPDSLTVTDAQGRRVAGTVALNGRRLDFVPAQAWTEGTYTLRLGTGLRDTGGNLVPDGGRSWTFTIDSTVPSVVATTPVPGALNVATGTTVVIEFSEPPSPESVHAGTIVLLQDSHSVAATLSIQDHRVVLTPAMPLQPASTYQVSVHGVTDRAGNGLPFADWSFETEAGRLAAPVRISDRGLYGAPVVTIGDVNGDGRNDVVLVEESSSPLEDGLYVMYGQADRTLAAPARISLDVAFGCAVRSLVVGDVDGDGRADVAVAGHCGVHVLKQSAEGALLPAEVLAPSASLLRLADLDGNGKPVLVGLSGAEVHIWRRKAAGRMQASQVIESGLADTFDVLVSDVDGDGHRDLVVVGLGDASREIVVLSRQAGGRFAPVQFMGSGSLVGARAIAAADFDGDGRVDLAAASGGGTQPTITVFGRSASGAWRPTTTMVVDDGAFTLAVADIDRDGRFDLVVGHGRTVGLLLQRSGGGFLPEERYRVDSAGTSSRQSLAVGDLNGDARPDIVMAGQLVLQRAQGDATSIRPSSHSGSGAKGRWPLRSAVDLRATGGPSAAR